MKNYIVATVITIIFAASLAGCNQSGTGKQSDNDGFLIVSDPAGIEGTRFSLNSSGHAVVTWQHGESGSQSLLGIYYDPNAGWSDQAVINRGSSIAEEVAVDENNDCFTVWEGNQAVGTNRYDATTSGWSSVSSIPTGSSVSEPVLAPGPQGSAFALWMEYEYNGTTKSIWVSSYEAGTGWTTAQPVPELALINSYTIAVDGSAMRSLSGPNMSAPAGFSKSLHGVTRQAWGGARPRH